MRKDANKLVKLYNQGYSCGDIGGMYGISRQSVWEILDRRGVKFRKKKLLPFIMYDGLKFTMGPYGYYRATIRKKHISLHRYKWEKEVGPIPAGYDIHHIDEDKTNNDLDNLECISKSDHTKKYSPRHNQYKNKKTIANGTWKSKK